jgi:hypothetical protein
MAIISTATVKTLLGLSGTSEDSKLDLLCGYADRAIKEYLGIDIESTSYPGAATNGKGDSGFYSGNGSRHLVLRQWPVTAITSVYLDAGGYFGHGTDAFASATLLTVGTDYAIRWDTYEGGAKASRCAILEKLNGTWPQSRWYKPGSILLDPQPAQGNIKIAYTAGFATVPGAITQAAALLVSHWRRVQQAGGFVTSESQGAYSYSVAQPTMTGGLPDEVKGLLSAYREARFA